MWLILCDLVLLACNGRFTVETLACLEKEKWYELAFWFLVETATWTVILVSNTRYFFH